MVASSSSSSLVHGTVAPGFESVHSLFEAGFRNGYEDNAQLCVYVQGRRVVDLWGGRDPAYSADTLQTVFSSTKCLAAIMVATLVDKGLLDYKAPVSKYWPEFGQAGKDGITVADVLRHEAGLVHFDETIRSEDALAENILQNKIGRVIERTAPLFPPDHFQTNREYHAFTRGLILNELFRRVDPEGRTLGQALRRDVSDPLGADVYIGLPEQELGRVAELTQWSVSKTLLESCRPAFLGRRIRPNILELLGTRRKLNRRKREVAVKRKPTIEGIDQLSPSRFVHYFNRPLFRMGEAPSGNGSCSARGLACVGACVVLGGQLDGVRVLKEETCKRMHEDIIDKDDHSNGVRRHFSQGGIHYYAPTSPSDRSRHSKVNRLREGFYGWMGIGGSVFQWRPDLGGVSFAYTPTLVNWADLRNTRGAELQDAVVRCLQKMAAEAAAGPGLCYLAAASPADGANAGSAADSAKSASSNEGADAKSADAAERATDEAVKEKAAEIWSVADSAESVDGADAKNAAVAKSSADGANAESSTGGAGAVSAAVKGNTADAADGEDAADAERAMDAAVKAKAADAADVKYVARAERAADAAFQRKTRDAIGGENSTDSEDAADSKRATDGAFQEKAGDSADPTGSDKDAEDAADALTSEADPAEVNAEDASSKPQMNAVDGELDLADHKSVVPNVSAAVA